MAKKRSVLVLQLCGLFLVCVLSAIVGIALRRSSGSVGNNSRQLAVQQPDEKVIKRQQHENEPFEISDVSIQNVNVLFGEKLNVLRARTGYRIFNSQSKINLISR